MKDEIYNLLTDKENFESAFEVRQQMQEITERLKKEFWELVSKRLEKNCEKTDWIFYPEDDDEIGLYLKEWDDDMDYYKFWIGYTNIGYTNIDNNLWYGLWIDTTKKRKFDLNRIDKFVKDNRSFKGFSERTSNNYWKKDTSYNFNELPTFKKILPHNNREEFACQLANELFEFAEEIKDDVIKMSKMLKK